jgi:4-hydroxy-3-methylbut-2-en-1-yl diphosphate reductase
MSVRRVLLVRPRGFCAGVARAVETVERALARYGAPVYVRRAIVHNAHVVGQLAGRGAIFVDELDRVPDGAVVVFSAHGVARRVELQAAGCGLRVVDATCPLVEKVHREVEQFAAEGYDVVLVGHAGHDEVVGTLGRARGVRLVTTPEDVARLEVGDPDRVACVTQTTLSIEDVAAVVGALQARFPALRMPAAGDVCYATRNRQRGARWLASRCDALLVLGDQSSSNAHRLREVGRAAGCPSFLVGSVAEVEAGWLADVETLGITAAASTPESVVEQAVEYFAAAGAVVDEETLALEPAYFPPPL